MNTSDLADQLAGANGLTKADAKKIVDGVFAAIAEAAAKGDEVSIPGFGKFKVKDVPADVTVVGVPARIVRRHGLRVDEAL